MQPLPVNPSVAELWLPLLLSRYPTQLPLELIHRAAGRCSRETGWAIGESFASSQQPLVQAMTFTSPDGRQQLQLRQHLDIPMIGFIDQQRFKNGRQDSAVLRSIFDHRNLDQASWGYTYLDTPLSDWWASAGWLVPDATWLNAEPDVGEYARLMPNQPLMLSPEQRLSRGDAMFFTTFGMKCGV